MDYSRVYYSYQDNLHVDSEGYMKIYAASHKEVPSPANKLWHDNRGRSKWRTVQERNSIRYWSHKYNWDNAGDKISHQLITRLIIQGFFFRTWDTVTSCRDSYFPKCQFHRTVRHATYGNYEWKQRFTSMNNHLQTTTRQRSLEVKSIETVHINWWSAQMCLKESDEFWMLLQQLLKLLWVFEKFLSTHHQHRNIVNKTAPAPHKVWTDQLLCSTWPRIVESSYRKKRKKKKKKNSIVPRLEKLIFRGCPPWREVKYTQIYENTDSNVINSNSKKKRRGPDITICAIVQHVRQSFMTYLNGIRRLQNLLQNCSWFLLGWDVWFR